MAGREGSETGGERSDTGRGRINLLRSIRVRMMLPIIVAAAGVAFLGLLRTNDALVAASAADRAQSLSMASGQLVTMVHLVGQEYIHTNAALRSQSPWTILSEEIAATNAAMANVSASIVTIRAAAPELSDLCAAVERSLASLEFARSSAPSLQDGSPALAAYYDVAMQALLAVVDAVPAHLSDTHLVELAQSLALVGHLDRLAVLQLDLIDRSLAHEAINAVDAVSLPEWAGEERARVAAVHNLAVASDRYAQKLGSSESSNANTIREAILGGRVGAELNENGQAWLAGQTERIDGLGDLRNLFIERLRVDTSAQGQSARNGMYATIGLSALVVGVTLVTAVLLAVRTTRRLRHTREAAVTAARIELPTAIGDVVAARDETMVRRALTTSSARVDAMLKPGPDEIGELAAAFGGVHRQALRLAADQALLRMEVQAMFIALSRRGQTLVQRQIQLIDEFGQREADPDALAQLFALDHLAARMRRNEENLLVLAGGEPGRWITRPVAMADLLRAAAQEIEEYRRVKVVYAPEIAVTAVVAGDAIHLLAELMENATTFSPPGSEVIVSAQREADGMTITVEDRGIGMPSDKVAEANHRLSHPSALTSSLVGTMGLLVIARLAERHGLTVRLNSKPAEGTTASVVLPDRFVTPIVEGTIQRGGMGSSLGFARDIAAAARSLPVPAAAVTTLPRTDAAPDGSPPAMTPVMPLHQPSGPQSQPAPRHRIPEPAHHQATPSHAQPPSHQPPSYAQPAPSYPQTPSYPQSPSYPQAPAQPQPPSQPQPAPAHPHAPTLAQYPPVPRQHASAPPPGPSQYPPNPPQYAPPGPSQYPPGPPQYAPPAHSQHPAAPTPGQYPPLPAHRPPLPQQREPHQAETLTGAGLPRRPDSDLDAVDLTGRQYLAVPETETPDPEAVRARLSSLSQGIAAASAHLSAPPVHPR